MNIQLINQESQLKKYLQPDKIVNVKVIKTEENKAVIEINGLKAEAAFSGDIPDNFFALIEASGDENGRRIFRLRILSSLNNAEYLQDKKKESLLENIKNILLENHLPLKDSFFEIALKMHQSGLKLDKELLKILHLASLKSGPAYADLLIHFLQNGIRLDLEFVDFFPQLKKLLKLYIQISDKENAGENTASRENRIDHMRILEGIFKLFLGNNGSCRISFLDDFKDIPVFERKEIKEDRERFYFDCSNDKTGGFIIVLDKINNDYSANIYLEPSFYKKHFGRENTPGADLGLTLSRKLDNKKIVISFNELKNPFLFWIMDKDISEKSGKRELFNLDISA